MAVDATALTNAALTNTALTTSSTVMTRSPIDPAVRAGIPITLPPASPVSTGPRWLLPAILVAGIAALVACLFVGGAATVTAVTGLPDAGAGTQWALPMASFIAETAAVLALGAALLATWLIPRRGELAAIRARCLRTAGSLAALASMATLVAFVLTVSDLTARPLPDALTWGDVSSVAAFGPGRLLLMSTALSAGGALGALLRARSLRSSCPGTSGAAGRQIWLVLTTGLLAAALIPWALGGHTTQSGADIAASSLIVHVLAAGAWIGGLAIMVLHVRGQLLATVLPRFSTLALWCWISIGVSGVITGWLRVGQVSDLWTSGYGRLLLVKLLALGVLGAFGYWHRRRLAAGLRARTAGQFGKLLRLAAVEVVIMGATMGVATALSATAPPVGHAVGHESAHGVPRIEALAGHPVPVISPENLAVLWRPDMLVLLLAAVCLAGYLIGVRRRRAAGGQWPVGRICWAVGATVAAVVVLNGGVATYDGVVWSVTVTQQAITSMVVPLAIVLARPWELLRGDGGGVDRAMGAVQAHRWLVPGLYAAWTALCLLTPVALWSVSSHGLLMVTRVGDIVIGVALFAVLLPSQRTSGRGSAPSGTALLIAWFAAQVALTGILLAGGAFAARPRFTELNIAWITVAQDERAAGLIHLGIATVVLLLVAALPGIHRSKSGHRRRQHATFSRQQSLPGSRPNSWCLDFPSPPTFTSEFWGGIAASRGAKGIGMRKKLLAVVGASACVLGIALLTPASASAADSASYQATLNPITANHVTGSGTAWVTVTGNSAEVKVEVSGLLDGAPHAQHIHIDALGQCPSQAQQHNGQASINVADGAPFYGAIGASLTNAGDTSPAAGLAVTEFPSTGSYTYTRTFDLDPNVVANLQKGTAVLVVHGVDYNNNGTYDDVLGASELDPSLPAEATDPALCGAFTAMQMSGVPSGAADTGGGSTATTGHGAEIGVGAAALLAVGGVAVIAHRRRRSAQD